jgi:hypothetical protein
MVLYLKSAADVFVVSKIRKAQEEIPLVSFQKFCFAYLNNDWIMAVSSLLTFTTSIALFIITSPLHGMRSES